MKILSTFALSCVLILTACESSQKITASWVNRDLIPKEPYKSIFILALASDNSARFALENRIGNYMTKRGKTVVKSSELFPAKFVDVSITKEQLAKIIKDKGCDGVFTISLLDTKTEQYYVPGTSYAPYAYGYYGSYYGYYGYYAPQAYTPGYYATDKTYYVETNFYDVASDKLIWSIQSSATNPTSFDSWFQDYSRLIVYKLQKEGLIKN